MLKLDPDNFRFIQLCEGLETPGLTETAARQAHISAAYSYLIPTVSLLAGNSIFPRYEKPCQPWHFPMAMYRVSTDIQLNCQWACCHLALGINRHEPEIIDRLKRGITGYTVSNYLLLAMHTLASHFIPSKDAESSDYLVNWAKTHHTKPETVDAEVLLNDELKFASQWILEALMIQPESDEATR